MRKYLMPAPPYKISNILKTSNKKFALPSLTRKLAGGDVFIYLEDAYTLVDSGFVAQTISEGRGTSHFSKSGLLFETYSGIPAQVNLTLTYNGQPVTLDSILPINNNCLRIPLNYNGDVMGWYVPESDVHNPMDLTTGKSISNFIDTCTDYIDLIFAEDPSPNSSYAGQYAVVWNFSSDTSGVSQVQINSIKFVLDKTANVPLNKAKHFYTGIQLYPADSATLRTINMPSATYYCVINSGLTNVGKILCYNNGNLYKSYDGINWKVACNISNYTGGYRYFYFRISKNYVFFVNAMVGEIYYSTDYGETWRETSIPSICSEIVASDGYDGTYVYTITNWSGQVSEFTYVSGNVRYCNGCYSAKAASDGSLIFGAVRFGGSYSENWLNHTFSDSSSTYYLEISESIRTFSSKCIATTMIAYNSTYSKRCDYIAYFHSGRLDITQPLDLSDVVSGIQWYVGGLNLTEFSSGYIGMVIATPNSWSTGATHHRFELYTHYVTPSISHDSYNTNVWCTLTLGGFDYTSRGPGFSAFRKKIGSNYYFVFQDESQYIWYITDLWNHGSDTMAYRKDMGVNAKWYLPLYTQNASTGNWYYMFPRDGGSWKYNSNGTSDSLTTDVMSPTGTPLAATYVGEKAYVVGSSWIATVRGTCNYNPFTSMNGKDITYSNGMALLKRSTTWNGVYVAGKWDAASPLGVDYSFGSPTNVLPFDGKWVGSNNKKLTNKYNSYYDDIT